MSDTAAEGRMPTSGPRSRERAASPTSRHESTSRNGSRQDRHHRDDRHDNRSRSHRDSSYSDRNKHRSSRDDREERGSSNYHRRSEHVGARQSASSNSKRHRDDPDRDDRRHRRHRDEDRSSSSRGRTSRRDPADRSHRHHSSSSRLPRDEKASRTSSSRNLGQSSHRRSRSRSPLLPTPSFVSEPRLVPPSPPPPASLQEQEADQDAPNFAPSGLLAAESNTVNGVALKYHEPPEARKPKSPWRLYCFKDGKEQELLHLGGAQSAYLLGRDRTVVDIPLDHESCSKQHAVIQFRQTITTNEFGDKKKRIQPFLIDLESSNGSYVNDTEIPTSRYYQLRTGDTLTFGASTREYVLLDESSS